MNSARAHRRGFLLMVGATLCWSSAGVLVRNMQITDSWEITFWRSVFMVLFLGGWLWQQHRGKTWRRIRAVGTPGVVSGSLFTIMFVGFIFAIAHTTVANTLIVISSAPFFAALFGWLFLRERVALRTWLAMLAAFLGIVVMFLGAASHDRWVGAVVALAVPVAYGLNVSVLRHMHATVDMIPAILIAGVISAALTLPFALPFSAGGRDLVLLAVMGAVQLGLGCVLLMIASRTLAAAEIGLVSILETVFGTLSVWVLVGERPSDTALLGGAIVIAALTANQLLALRKHKGVEPFVIT
jgi:drug/metabolite transporter (DMT)-like permease